MRGRERGRGREKGDEKERGERDKGETHGISKKPRSCKRNEYVRTTRESERAVGEAGKRMYVVLREGAQARRCYTIYVGIFYMYVDI